jgi:hypothetical protein
MAITAENMILRALQIIGEKRVGDSLTTNEKSTYLYALNSMLDSWSLDRLLVYQLLQENFSLVAGTASYTIGSGATFNTTRPTRVDYPSFVRDVNGYDQPVRIITPEAYKTLVAKGTGNTYPGYLAYDPTYDASGYGVIYVYPKPTTGLTLYINSWKQLQSFSAVTTTLALPPGYQRAIETNLAIEICPGYIDLQPEAIKNAKEAKALIKGVNLPDPIMRIEDAAAGRGGSRARVNIFTGP